MFKRKEKKVLNIEYSSNRFFQSWLTLMKYLEDNKNDYLLGKGTDTELAEQLVKELDYHWVKDFNNFRWIKDFGELVIHVSKVLFMENSSKNPVFVAEKDGDIHVCVQLPRFIVAITFYSMGELGRNKDTLESWINSDKCSDYVGIKFKEDFNGSVIFELDLEDNDNMAHNVKGKPLFDILTIGANDAIEKTYNKILDYTITTYYSITEEECKGMNWKDLLTHGL